MLARRVFFHLKPLFQARKLIFASFPDRSNPTWLPIKHFSSKSSKTSLDRSEPVIQINPETGQPVKPPKKKTAPIPKITLLQGSEVSVTTLEDAQKIAKRRDLKIVKVIDLDTKSERPVYKLMTGAQYLAEDLKQREHKKSEKQKSPFKGEKVLILSQNISEHDLQTNVRKILKWLDKKYEVRMVINGNAENNSKAENVYSMLEKNVASFGRIVQKRQKGSDIKFQILPPKEPKQSDSDGGRGPDGSDRKNSSL